MTREARIYAILDEDDVPIYVGATIMSMPKRMWYHWSGRGWQKHKLALWLRSLPSPPVAQVLETVDETEKHEAERRWIADYQLKYELLNETVGGPGTPGYRHSKQARRARSKAMMGHEETLLTRAKIASAHSGRTIEACIQMWQERDLAATSKCAECGKRYKPGRGLTIHMTKIHS